MQELISEEMRGMEGKKMECKGKWIKIDIDKYLNDKYKRLVIVLQTEGHHGHSQSSFATETLLVAQLHFN